MWSAHYVGSNGERERSIRKDSRVRIYTGLRLQTICAPQVLVQTGWEHITVQLCKPCFKFRQYIQVAGDRDEQAAKRGTTYVLNSLLCRAARKDA